MTESSKTYADKDFIVLFIPKDEIDDFGAILNCAVRYCIGRESYMPNLVMKYIMKHPHILTPKSVGCMIHDLEHVKEQPQTEWEKAHNRTAFGLDYQQDLWMQFLSWLKERMKEMEQNG